MIQFKEVPLDHDLRRFFQLISLQRFFHQFPTPLLLFLLSATFVEEPGESPVGAQESFRADYSMLSIATSFIGAFLKTIFDTTSFFL